MKKRGVSFSMRTKTWKEARTALPVSSKESVAEKLENYKGVSISLYNTINVSDKLFQKPETVIVTTGEGYPKGCNCKKVVDGIRKFIKFTKLKIFIASNHMTFSIDQNVYHDNLVAALTSAGLTDLSGRVSKRDMELVVDIIKTMFEVISENLDEFFSTSTDNYAQTLHRIVFRSAVISNREELNNFMVKSFSTGKGLQIFKDNITDKFMKFRVDNKLYKEFNSDIIDAIIQEVEAFTW